MNAPGHANVRLVPPLFVLALSSLNVSDAELQSCSEARWLCDRRQSYDHGCRDGLQAWLEAPPQEDLLLHALAMAERLNPVEVIAVAIAMAVENDAMAGRAVAWLQTPVAGSRPTLGLVLAAADALGVSGSAADILEGTAREVGLLHIESGIESSSRPLCEQIIRVPVPLLIALREGQSQWPGVKLERCVSQTVVPSLQSEAAHQARALKFSDEVLAIRSRHPRESRVAAALVANELGMQAAFLENEPSDGVGLWLVISGAVPVFCRELAPGEICKLPKLSGYTGPVLVACGPDGGFERDGDAVSNWSVPLPLPAEREVLWRQYVEDAAVARRIGSQNRYSAARIHRLGCAARYEAKREGDSVVGQHHIHKAARSGVGAELGTLAELIPEDIQDDVLVIPPDLREALSALRKRCELRENLAQELGSSASTRYKPGVRALFVGPSGTGKTLAAGWLATQLGLPLYRVDVASVTSKYIGETEKNLARLFARAEHSEVVLLFDEADSLFGKRTEVKEANDRFANAQTNYVLQRIESFEGIIILTSNSRTRFDSAFTRRLDKILDFPQPTPDERRALWASHLGDHHVLTCGELNRLAAVCDLAGGHIRNVVLEAAARARHKRGKIEFADVLYAVTAEFRKLGRQTPAGLIDGQTRP